MNQILEQLGTYGIVPVVVLQDAAKAEPLAKALCKGGLACAEVTFRTDAAEESIRIMSEKFPEMLVGAGTVLTIEQADCAVKAGAKFIVSPGLNPEVVKWCQAHEVPVIPGIVTPTEMEQAIGLGLTMVKFLPAEPADCLIVFSVCSTALMVLFPEVRTVCLFIDSVARFSRNFCIPSFALDTFRFVSSSPLRPCLSNWCAASCVIRSTPPSTRSEAYSSALCSSGCVVCSAFSFVCT